MNWTKEQYLEYMENRRRQSSGIVRRVSVPVVTKYHSEKTKVDGHVFDSVREASVYQDLKIAERSGVISNMERAVYYIADFRYKASDGHVVVVDVKSKITEANPVYRLKRKLFLFRYPDIDFVEMF